MEKRVKKNVNIAKLFSVNSKDILLLLKKKVMSSLNYV